MIEQINNYLDFDAFYTEGGLGAEGLTVTATVFRGGTEVQTNQAATEVGNGFYTYRLALGSVTNKNNYRAVFHTDDTDVDQQDLPALWVVGLTWVERLDATLSVIADAIADIAATLAAGVPAIITQAVATMIAALQGDRITITRDSDFVALIPVPGGISATRDDSLFTVKTEEQVNTGAADSQSLIQVSENEGLLYLNSTEGAAAEGTLTVVDEMDDDGVGWFRLELTSATTAQLERRTGSKYLKSDYKVVEAGGDLQRTKHDLDIVGSVGRTITIAP